MAILTVAWVPPGADQGIVPAGYFRDSTHGA